MKVYLVIAALGVTLFASQLFFQQAVTQKFENQLASQAQKFESITEIQQEVSLLRQEISILEAVKSRTSQGQAISAARFHPTKAHHDDPFIGSKDAPILVMAFLDYQCGPCRAFVEQTLPKLKKNYFDDGKARFLLRDFPLTSHAQAVRAATFAHCAGEQGAYWDAFNLLYEKHSLDAVDQGNFEKLAPKLEGLNQKRLLRCTNSERYQQEVLDDKAEGKSVGAVGAPGFFIGAQMQSGDYNGVFIRGAQPYSVFEQQLKRFEGAH